MHDRRSRHRQRQRRHAGRRVRRPSVAIKDEKDPRRRRARRDAAPRARPLDATGLHVLPGAIDVHVHFRDPGYPHKEDWESGTAAAAFGGVTTVFDMPNTIPPTGNGTILAEKHAIAAVEGACRFRPLRAARRGHHRQCAGADRRRRDRVQALHGQHLRQDSIAVDRRDAGGVRGRAPRPASASRCMPRPIRSWSGGRPG